MRRATFSLVISTILVGSGWAQGVAPPIPQPRPAVAAKPQSAKPVRDGIIAVSKSPLPSYDQGSYQRIQAAMLSYASIEVRGGWPSLPPNARLDVGASGPEVALLRRRLVATDDLAPDHIAGEVYDERLAAAVRRFQARHGLEETGSIGPRTLTALNVPVQHRLRQLAASLDRLAELNFTFGQRYVVVNIPAAVAEAVDGDNVQHRYVVVVGKIDRPSPTLTTSITAINLNPTWTVPLSILKKDIVTRMRKNPNYIARMRMRVLDGNGGEIDPRSVDWHSDRAPNFTVRQDAGPGNALGALRIDMPNSYAVYMHDTNHKEHFSADYRFQSSGCTRVAEVRDLAVWLLADNPGWGRRELDAAIAKGQSSTVRLTHKVPVAWAYMTGWVTRDDTVHFRGDIYNYDPEHGRVPVAHQARPPVVMAARASGFVLQSAEPPKPRAVEQVSYLDSR
jgi:murein L,D-transpeptidase YcbB/YkuD